MWLESPAYRDGETIPARFATRQVAGGEGLSVPLSWSDEPPGTGSFVLAMIDHHPIARGWVHWLVVDVPAGVHQLAEGASGGAAMPAGAIELAGTADRIGYSGPQPPVGSGVHDYVITLYALDAQRVGVLAGSTWEDAREAMTGHVLGSAALLGRFGR
jgi:Raf kinase inhibitor-like YbhB/YbcL family protein